MNILKVRHQIKSEGISFYDLPLRVAYYARVSTEFMEQLNSLENQKKFFTDYIGNMPNWEFAGGYIDEGLSGITTKKRERFNEMIEDALNDNFDLIVTKSISRFARNTADCFVMVRALRASRGPCEGPSRSPRCGWRRRASRRWSRSPCGRCSPRCRTAGRCPRS